MKGLHNKKQYKIRITLSFVWSLPFVVYFTVMASGFAFKHWFLFTVCMIMALANLWSIFNGGVVVERVNKDKEGH